MGDDPKQSTGCDSFSASVPSPKTRALPSPARARLADGSPPSAGRLATAATSSPAPPWVPSGAPGEAEPAGAATSDGMASVGSAEIVGSGSEMDIAVRPGCEKKREWEIGKQK